MVYVSLCAIVCGSLGLLHGVALEHVASSRGLWVNFIKCYQQLRFFGDGTAHLLLTNEEHRPQYVISVLRPLLCTEPFLVGSWQLDGSIDRISNLRSPHEHSPSNCYYRMTLALGSKPLGT